MKHLIIGIVFFLSGLFSFFVAGTDMLFDDGLIAFLIPLSIVFMTLGSVLLIIEYFKKEKN